MNLLTLEADLECDENTFTYPTTFHANMIFNRMIALHTQIMTEKGNNLEAQIDILARLTKNVYGGTELIYDDKAKGLIFLKYGLFWKVEKNFNVGVEYNHIGDKYSLDGSVYHRATPLTSVGSTFSLDFNTKKIGMKAAFNHTLDAHTAIKTRVDSFGALDVTATAKISDKLTASFTTGGNISAFFSGKTNDEAYSGLNFKFSL